MAVGLALATPLAATGAPVAAGRAWRAPVEVAEGPGVRGEWRQNESQYDHVDDGTPAFDGAGGWVVAWVDQGRKDVLLQRFTGEGQPRGTAPVNVSRSPDIFSWLPRVQVAAHQPDEIHVLWQEIIFSGGSHGGEIFYARSRDGGASFDVPHNLSQSIGGDGKGRINRSHWQNGSHDLALASDGTLYASWTEFDGQLWFSRSTDGGSTFSSAQRIVADPREPARGPALAVAPNGTVHLAWTVGETATADIRIARSTDRGVTFSTPEIVHATPHYSDAPKIAVDAAGVLHVVYAESVGGPFDAHEIRYARSTDGGRRFSPPQTVSPRAADGSGSATFPGLGVDPAGTITITWEAARNANQRPRGLGLARSTDGGSTFTPPESVPHSRDPSGGTNGSHQGLLMRKLAVSTSGALALVNSSLQPDVHSRVWLLLGAPPETAARRE